MSWLRPTAALLAGVLIVVTAESWPVILVGAVLAFCGALQLVIRNL